MNFKNIGLVLFILMFGLSCQFVQSFFLKSGIVYTIKVEPKDKKNIDLLKRAPKILEQRLSSIEIPVEAKLVDDSNKVQVKVYGKQDFNLVKKLLLFEADLLFMKVVSPPNPNLATYPTREAALQTIGGQENSKRKVYKYVERDSADEKQPTEQWIVVENPPIITGEFIRDSKATSFLENDNNYQIQFSLNPEGANKFGEWTGKNIGNYLAVVLNDKAESVAFIQSKIFDQGQISGNFSKQQAEDLALIFKSGYLPAKLTLLEEKPFENKPE